MNPYAYLLWLWLTFFSPQPAPRYFVPMPPTRTPVYWQATMPTPPAGIIGDAWSSPGPVSIPMAPCRQLQPGLTVCS